MDIEYITIKNLTLNYVGDENIVNLFKKYFPKGGYAIDVLKKFAELRYYSFTQNLIWTLPFNEIPLHLNKVTNSTFYLGDVIVNSDVCITEPSFIKGDLIVKGNLTVCKAGYIVAKEVKANNISIYDSGGIYGDIRTNHIVICADKTNNLKLNISAKDDESSEIKYSLYGVVIANVINNRGGLLDGTYYINDIIGDREVNGNIVFKESRKLLFKPVR